MAHAIARSSSVFSSFAFTARTASSMAHLTFSRLGMPRASRLHNRRAYTTMPARREDWPERMLENLERHGALPLIWGQSDCFTLGMDNALAVTGADPWAAERDYSTEAQAARRLARHGFRDVGDAFAAVFPEIPPALAHRGDLGVVESPRGIAGVVFVGADVVGKAEFGTQRQPRAGVLRAFRV
jgi:hypothetical protein